MDDRDESKQRQRGREREKKKSVCERERERERGRERERVSGSQRNPCCLCDLKMMSVQLLSTTLKKMAHHCENFLLVEYFQMLFENKAVFCLLCKLMAMKDMCFMLWPIIQPYSIIFFYEWLLCNRKDFICLKQIYIYIYISIVCFNFLSSGTLPTVK